jgi:hypothetical protein
MSSQLRILKGLDPDVHPRNRDYRLIPQEGDVDPFAFFTTAGALAAKDFQTKSSGT